MAVAGVGAVTLHPTPTRLSLLAAIAAGRVTGQAGAWWHRHGGRVTAATAELQRAGWVTPGGPPGAADRPSTATAAPLPLGRYVLATAGRCGHCGSAQPRVDGAVHVTTWVCAHGPWCEQSECLPWGLCKACADKAPARSTLAAPVTAGQLAAAGLPWSAALADGVVEP